MISSSEPLDVYVGCSIKTFLTEYLTNIPDYRQHSLVDYSDRLWMKLDSADDKLFYSTLMKVIDYMKGNSIASKSSDPWAKSSLPIDLLFDDEEEEEDDNAVDEYGEIIRDDQLIRKRQILFLEQGLLDLVICMLNKILPLFKGDNSPGSYVFNDSSNAIQTFHSSRSLSGFVTPLSTNESRFQSISRLNSKDLLSSRTNDSLPINDTSSTHLFLFIKSSFSSSPLSSSPLSPFKSFSQQIIFPSNYHKSKNF